MSHMPSSPSLPDFLETVGYINAGIEGIAGFKQFILITKVDYVKEFLR